MRFWAKAKKLIPAVAAKLSVNFKYDIVIP